MKRKSPRYLIDDWLQGSDKILLPDQFHQLVNALARQAAAPE